MSKLLDEHGITSKRSQALIDYAYAYAKQAHGDQKRKYTGEPYIVHPVSVAQTVASVTDDVEMICATLLSVLLSGDLTLLARARDYVNDYFYLDTPGVY